MSKNTFQKITKFIVPISFLLFALVFTIFAWTEPAQAPPAGNTAAPLNVSATAQTKAGALTIAAGGGEALILQNGGDIRLYNANNSGSALLYVDSNGEIITPGNLKAGSVSIKGDSSISTNLNSDKLDSYHAADLLAQSGGGGSFVNWSGTTCPAGWTVAYAGYGPFIGLIPFGTQVQTVAIELCLPGSTYNSGNTGIPEDPGNINVIRYGYYNGDYYVWGYTRCAVCVK